MKGIHIPNFAPTRTDFFARSVSPYLGQWEGEERFLPLLLSYADRGGGGGSVGYDCGNLNADKSKIPPPFSQALSKEKEKTRENFFKSRGRGGVGGRGREKNLDMHIHHFSSCTSARSHLCGVGSSSSSVRTFCGAKGGGGKTPKFSPEPLFETQSKNRPTSQPLPPPLFCPLDGW